MINNYILENQPTGTTLEKHHGHLLDDESYWDNVLVDNDDEDEEDDEDLGEEFPEKESGSR